ncbi:MAG: hypothetical protein ACJAZN_003558 [Planctomycetota bacterium]
MRHGVLRGFFFFRIAQDEKESVAKVPIRKSRWCSRTALAPRPATTSSTSTRDVAFPCFLARRRAAWLRRARAFSLTRSPGRLCPRGPEGVDGHHPDFTSMTTRASPSRATMSSSASSLLRFRPISRKRRARRNLAASSSPSAPNSAVPRRHPGEADASAGRLATSQDRQQVGAIRTSTAMASVRSALAATLRTLAAGSRGSRRASR